LACAIDRVAALVSPSLPEPVAAPQSEAWTSLRRQLGEAYDTLVAILRADVTEARPTNYVRAGFHVTSALAGLIATLVVFTAEQLPFAAGTLAVTSWTLEILRRRSPALNERLMGYFRHIARPGEALRINSGTWYMTALVVLTLTYSPLLCVVAVAVLGFADPAAAIIGRRFGRVRLRHGRTLEGTAAFVAVGTLAALFVMALLPNPPGAAIGWPVAIAAALCGGFAELFSRRIDDNLAIPIAAMAGAWTMLGLLGASAW